MLEVRGVRVRFGGVAALTDVSLVAESGLVTGLIGPNGAGKTTLFNVISGLQRPDRGQVLIGGADATRLGPHRRARLGLGRTFQRLELFGSLSIVDNVRVGLDAKRRAARVFSHVRGAATATATATATSEAETVRALLARVGVLDAGGTIVGSLPTGTARLVELARALAIDPRVLLLDEPGSGLDDTETEALGDLLRSLAAEERAVLLVEHDMDLVLKVCDVVYVLDFGEIIASGTPEEIRADAAVQAAYLGRSDDAREDDPNTSSNGVAPAVSS